MYSRVKCEATLLTPANVQETGWKESDQGVCKTKLGPDLNSTEMVRWKLKAAFQKQMLQTKMNWNIPSHLCETNNANDYLKLQLLKVVLQHLNEGMCLFFY